MVRTPRSFETAIAVAMAGLTAVILARVPSMSTRPPLPARYNRLMGGTGSPTARLISRGPARSHVAQIIAAAASTPAAVRAR